jgi:hypothetical protein
MTASQHLAILKTVHVMYVWFNIDIDDDDDDDDEDEDYDEEDE